MITQLPTRRSIMPIRIFQARVSRSFSQEELASAVQVTKQAISKYETGAARPSDAVIVKIAEVLEYPLSFFENEPGIVSAPQSTCFFRSYKTSSKKERLALTERGEIFEDTVFGKLKTYVAFPEPNLLDIEQDGPYTQDDCEDIAMRLRKLWGIGTGPIDRFVDIVQENGIIIANMPCSEPKIDAFSFMKNGIPYIFISGNTVSSVRWRYSLAHEIGHLILHSEYFNKRISQSDHDRLEEEANSFASALLLPQQSFFEDVTVASVEYFLYLKKKWKVSISAMIMKCKLFGLLSDAQVGALYRKLAIKGWRKAEPLDNICQHEKPYLLKQAFELILDNNIIARENIEKEFGLYVNELAELTFTPIEVFRPTSPKPQPLKLLR